MEEVFKIYVDQLRNGQVESFDETVKTSFLQFEEEETRFDDKMHLKGEAYLAENELVIHLHAMTHVYIPCTICNTPVKILMDLDNLYLTAEPEEYKSGIFHFNERLRESILLEMPQFAECNEGKCPQRKEIGIYLANPDQLSDKKDLGHGYNPFANLDLDQKVE